jgi:hypothetical protein
MTPVRYGYLYQYLSSDDVKTHLHFRISSLEKGETGTGEKGGEQEGKSDKRVTRGARGMLHLLKSSYFSLQTNQWNAASGAQSTSH